MNLFALSQESEPIIIMHADVHSDILHREQLTTRHLDRVPNSFLVPSVIC